MSFSKDKNGFAVLGLFRPNPFVTDLNSSRLPSTMSAKVSMEMSRECLWAVGNQPGNWLALRQCCRNGAAKLAGFVLFLSFSGAGVGLLRTTHLLFLFAGLPISHLNSSWKFPHDPKLGGTICIVCHIGNRTRGHLSITRSANHFTNRGWSFVYIN